MKLCWLKKKETLVSNIVVELFNYERTAVSSMKVSTGDAPVQRREAANLEHIFGLISMQLHFHFHNFWKCFIEHIFLYNVSHNIQIEKYCYKSPNVGFHVFSSLQ